MEEFNDKLHGIIKERLAERDRKIQNINEWTNKQDRVVVLRPVLGLVVAACLVGAIFLLPWNGTSEDTDVIRGASGNIDELIRSEKYDAALIVIEKELYSSDSTLKAIQQDTCTIMDDETEYNMSAIKLRISELEEKKQMVTKKLNE